MQFKLRYRTEAIFCSFLALLLLISPCAKIEPLGPTSQIAMLGNLPIFEPCRDLVFPSEGRWLTPGNMIGEGAYGKVYELLSSEEPASDLVLKTISSKHFDEVNKWVTEEVNLARDLPEFFTPTVLKNVYEVRLSNGSKYYSGLLIKKRVNGLHLYDIANRLHGDVDLDYKELFESFSKFRTDLIHKLDELSRRDIYIYDFHSKNIMYDQVEKRWYLIDGNHESRWTDFLFEIFMLNTPDNTATQIPQIFQLITPLDFGPPFVGSERQEFFTKYVDIYMAKYLEKLRVLKNQFNEI